MSTPTEALYALFAADAYSNNGEGGPLPTHLRAAKLEALTEPYVLRSEPPA